jgi:hypothetical protein
MRSLMLAAKTDEKRHQADNLTVPRIRRTATRRAALLGRLMPGLPTQPALNALSGKAAMS